MGRLQIVRTAMGAMLVGSVALAQQGLIAEPWKKAAQPAAAPVPPVRAMPASGLGPAAGASATSPRKLPASPTSPPVAVLRWSPPVVPLLVDPWAKRPVPAPTGARWVPSTVEIVDPWADATAHEPRVASRQPSPQHSTIF